MSMGPNEKALREGYKRFADGRPDLTGGAFAHDIVWISPGAPNRLEMAGEWRGLKGVQEYFYRLAVDWTLVSAVLEEVITRDDRRFAVHSTINAISNVTGKPVEFRKIDLVSMRDGKITHCTETYDTFVAVLASRL